MDTQDYIWVRSITGTVIGFTPEDIVRFEREYRAIRHLDVDRWDYFNYYYSDELNNQEVTGYSTLWHFDTAWRKLDALMAREE